MMQKNRSKRVAFQERTNTLTTLEPTQMKTGPLQSLISQGSTSSSASSMRARNASNISPSQKDEITMLNPERNAKLELNNLAQDEKSTSQLQIDMLHSATALFNARLEHAMHEVERLRTLLADRSIAPSEYQALQRQRLVQERWLLSAQGFSTRLESDSRWPNARNLRPYPQPETISASQSEFDANLNDYRQDSEDKTSFRSRALQRAPQDHKPNTPPPPPRSRHNGLLVLNLASRYPPPPKPRRHPVSTSTVVEDPSHPSHPPAAPANDPPNPPSPAKGSGTAKIWRSSIVRSKDQILAEVVVSMPDYVNDLLAELDSAVPDTSPKLQDPSTPTLATPKRSSRTANKTLRSQSSRTSFKLPSLLHREETPSSPPSRSTTPQLPTTPSRRRLSAILAFPEALSSRISLRSSTESQPPNVNTNNSRAGWRMSSPPSSFPAGFRSEGVAPTSRPSGAGVPASPSAKDPLAPNHRRGLQARKTSISLSDLRSAANANSSSSSKSITSSPIKQDDVAVEVGHQQPPPVEPKNNRDSKILSKLRHRMSALRRF